MQITVVGLGYVGLVTAGCLAAWDHNVIGVEADARRLADLKRGVLPFHEPALNDLIDRGLDTGRLQVEGPDEMRPSVSAADVVIVAVGTHDGNGGWQTETARRALADLVPHLRAGTVLVIRSTLPPEFIHQLPRLVADLRGKPEPDVAIVLNPEFTQEGRAVRDFMQPTRVICGAIHDPDGIGEDRLRTIFSRTDSPFLLMSGIDASFAKLGSNLFLATKISFANELATLCDAYGARVDAVVSAMGLDPRIGPAFLGAGVGFGGSCLPHQVTMTVKTAQVAGVPTPILAAVDEVNDSQRAAVVGRLEHVLPAGLAGTRIALLGLTFKPDTDDLRDAPAITIAKLLLERGATVVAYDPMDAARTRAADIVSGLHTAASAEAALDGADAAVVITEWREVRDIDWVAARALMRRPIVVDGRNCLDGAALASAGFTYTGFGRGWSGPVPEAMATRLSTPAATMEVA
jgi:UDPglucose 6-dehydrogenase